MAIIAQFVVGSAMAAITTCRIKFALDPVESHVISPVLHLPVRTITVFCGRFHLGLVCMTVVTKGALMAQGA